MTQNSAPAEDAKQFIFIPKATTLLSADSPFFDALWPKIFDAAEPETRNALESTSLFFRKLAKRAKASKQSRRIKELYLKISVVDNAGGFSVIPNPLKLDPHSELPLWYEWSADKAGFKSIENLEEFCRLADVCPAEGINFPYLIDSSHVSTSFTSSAGDINFLCYYDPREADQGAYVHYFGCTGEREKALKLELWFMKNCQWEEVSHGGRDFM